MGTQEYLIVLPEPFESKRTVRLLLLLLLLLLLCLSLSLSLCPVETYKIPVGRNCYPPVEESAETHKINISIYLCVVVEPVYSCNISRV